MFEVTVFSPRFTTEPCSKQRTILKRNKLIQLLAITAHPENHQQSNHQYTMIENLTMDNSSSSNWILMSCQPHRVTSGQADAQAVEQINKQQTNKT